MNRKALNNRLLETFGKNMRRVRIERGLRRTHLSKLVGISIFRLNQLELGEFEELDLETLVTISKILAVMPTELLRDSSNNVLPLRLAGTD